MKFSLLIIDPQVDFHPGGALPVAGAAEDSTRIANLILNKKSEIEDIFVTLDTHDPDHIAHAKFWRSPEQCEPTPFQQISHEDVTHGTWTPSNESLREHSLRYTKQLEESGKFKLTIWPEHCVLGTPGHEVVDVLKNAIREWEEAQHKSATYINKGMNNLTEMYSAIKAEVPVDDDVSTKHNTALLTQLANTQKLVVCGQALSHCVNHTLRDILDYWLSPPVQRCPGDLVLLHDGTSPVSGFEQEAEAFINFLRNKQVRVASCEEILAST